MSSCRYTCNPGYKVMKKPKDMKVKDENDFEWLKQSLPQTGVLISCYGGFLGCSLLQGRGYTGGQRMTMP